MNLKSPLRRDLWKAEKASVQGQDKGRAPSELEQMVSAAKLGSPMVWLPSLLKAHFHCSELAAPSVSPKGTTQDDRNVPACERAQWHVRVPIDEQDGSLATLLLAAAELERRAPFVRILDLSISQDWEQPAQRVVVMDLDILSPKADIGL